MDATLRHLRHAFRFLGRNPAFAAVAILTLGLGIGANTAVFSVLHAVVLRPLPFHAEEELVEVWQHAASYGETFEYSYPDWEDLRASARSAVGLAAVGNLRHFVFEREDEAVAVRGGIVTADLFDVLAVAPLIGRRLEPADGVRGAERVVVLSHAFWQRAFGGDRTVLGRAIRLDARDFTVVGIMPPGFEYPPRSELWVPVEQVAERWVGQRGVGFLHLVGRLEPGEGAERLRQELNAGIRRLPDRADGPFAEATAVVRPLRDALVGPARPALLLLLAGSGLVLLIACANVASMLLARGAARRHEVAVRSALGAGRARLIRHYMAESLVLAGLGAAAGVGLCLLGMEPLVRLSPIELYRGEAIGIVPEVLAFTVGLGALTAVLFGIAPALRGSRTDAAKALASAAGRTSTGGGDQRLIEGLVVGQVALAFTLLVTAGLLLRSYGELQAVDLGFEREGRLTLQLFVPPETERGPERNLSLFDDLPERVEALPGVRAAAGVLLRPLDGPEGHNAPFTVEGQTPEEHSRNPFMNYQAVTPGYFRTMGIPLHAGRDFDSRDTADGEPVVIVSRALAERYWPAQDPVGRRLKLGPPDSPAPWMTVVGVVGSARYRGLEEVTLDGYLPHRQVGFGLNHLVVEAAGEPGALVPLLREEIRSLDPGARAVDIASMDELFGAFLARPRFHTTLLGLFGGLTLALGAIGTYGVLAFAVGRRSREFAIRLATGAAAGDLLWGVLRRAAFLGLAGSAIGLVASLALSRALGGLLFGVRPVEPSVYLAVGTLLLGTALAAALVPALRAARSDPMEALRSE